MPDTNHYDIHQILNLKTNESIGPELAARQLEVIRRSYDFLNHPENNIIYIADEVGLGKTFIAIGIMLLTRHLSTDPAAQRDLIIVPKKNLQEKWRKELNNFAIRNYLPSDFIKQELSDHTAIYDKLMFSRADHWISIHRMSAFSALAAPKEGLQNHIMHNILQNDPFSAQVILKAWNKGYFLENKDDTPLRKLVACLLNANSAPIRCLVIDEAHNYKHGESRALRNIITSTFLGAVKDEKILQDFPELESRMKFPLAEKIICLSATPKDRALTEIRNQFNCFTNNHILQHAASVEDVKKLLPRFLIRGNLNYTINEETVSRNQCRVEHRQGNINKAETPERLLLGNDFESLCWQLLQYKSLKHLNAKNNASFEIGMLAGFESYRLDIEKRIRPKDVLNEEYELVADKTSNQSQDHDVVRKMIESYKERFEGALPPHPKQTKMEKEIIGQLTHADKSLIFVRRIASAYELKERLIEAYCKEIVCEKQLKTLTHQLRSEKVIKLINDYNDRKLLEQLPELWSRLAGRPDIKTQLRNHCTDNIQDQLTLMQSIYNLGGNFSIQAKNFIRSNKTNIPQDLKQALIVDIDKYRQNDSVVNKDEEIDDDVTSDQEEQGDNYFFTTYFKRGNTGYAYKAKMYRENWFDIDLLTFNKVLPFLIYDNKALDAWIKDQANSKTQKKHQVFQQRENDIRAFLSEHAKVNIDGPVVKAKTAGTTFLTYLLTGPCGEQTKQWLQKRSKQNAAIILDDLRLLGVILKNIFRNGSGLLAGFIADASGINFTKSMSQLLLSPNAPFHLVLKEVHAIINDFDLLLSTNFDRHDESHINAILRSASSPIVVTTGQDKINRGMMAAQFRMPGFPYVLVTTDIFREGEDLHTYCQNIYHYGIAWNPSDMEQRTGRIDRINSQSYRKLNLENKVHFDNKVQVFYPYMPQSVEVSQVVKLLNNMDKFTRTFNNIEDQHIYESEVSIHEIISESDIPKQIDERLISLYDIENFDTLQPE